MVAPGRRRGAELVDAILAAAWDQLREAGYAGFTYEAIADRARTSKPVLYRRWPTRKELLLATFRHYGEGIKTHTPATGSLRGDVLDLLRTAQARRVHDWAILADASLGGWHESGPASPAELRAAMIGDRADVMRQIIQRADERGEVDASRIPDRVISLPFDLFRHEAIMTLAAIPDESIVAIVDQIYLPLVAHYQESSGR